MSTLHVYGESYAANNDAGDVEYWTNTVANNLGLELRNHALGGTSTPYSMFKLSTDIKKKKILSSDVVIFCVSGFGRFTFHHQREHPDTAANMYVDPARFNEARNIWYRENQKEISWHLKNVDTDVQKLAHEGYRHIIRNYAETRPDIKLMLLSLDHFNVNFPMSTPPNMLIPTVTLNSISAGERCSGLDLDQLVKYTGIDPRVNHFSIPNARIFSKLVTESIQNHTIDNIALDMFETNIYDQPIETMNQYQQLINDGYLFPRPNLQARLR